jgi:hypothetical protein
MLAVPANIINDAITEIILSLATILYFEFSSKKLLHYCFGIKCGSYIGMQKQ